MADESILGVPRAHIIGSDSWFGLRREDAAEVLDIIASHGRYRPRSEAEDDPSWKQIIPYLLLRDGERLFLMQRTKAGSDRRLHDRWSIGIGGHLNPEDGDPVRGLQREFDEEMVADWTPEPTFLGVLNDDRTAVGAVHLGLVFSAEAGGRSISVRETHKLTGAFATVEQVREGYTYLETWSQIVFDAVTSETGQGSAG